MAKSQNNVVTHGLSGKIGGLLIFRQVGGKTIVSKIPEQSKTASEKQQKQRKRFQQAVLYAKSAFASPSIEALYAKSSKKGKNPFNVAVADFFNAPDIDSIDLSDYTGTPGDEIRIIASDDFAVKSVHVQIINADGSQVEEGEATHGAGDLWIYTAVQNNENLVGDKIIVTASDLPGNTAEKERTLSEG